MMKTREAEAAQEIITMEDGHNQTDKPLTITLLEIETTQIYKIDNLTTPLAKDDSKVESLKWQISRDYVSRFFPACFDWSPKL